MNKSIKNILTLALIAGIIFLFWYLKTLIAYLLISVVLSIVARPLCDFLSRIHIKKMKMPYSMCAGLSLMSILIFVFGVFYLFVPLILEQAKIISSIDAKAFVDHLNGPLLDLKILIEKYRLTKDVPVEVYIQDKFTSLITTVNVPKFLSSLMGVLGNIFVAFISIAFMTFFFLKDKDLFFRIVFSITPDEYVDEIKDVIRDTIKMLRSYFSGLILDIFIVSILVSIGLAVLGIKNALLIGFFAGVMTVIPYVGPFIGYLLALLIAFTTNIHLDFAEGLFPLMLKVSLVFVLVRLIDDILLQPYIFSNSVKAHPLEIFIVIMAAANIGGIVGMVIAVPTYTFLRIIAKEFFSKSKLVRAMTKNL